MVNVENINKVIAFMESKKLPWDMSNTNLCIIGQVRACFNDSMTTNSYAGEILFDETSFGLTEELFMPKGYHRNHSTNMYTRERAIAQLKYLRDTGKVDWNATP